VGKFPAKISKSGKKRENFKDFRIDEKIFKIPKFTHSAPPTPCAMGKFFKFCPTTPPPPWITFLVFQKIKENDKKKLKKIQNLRCSYVP
jgi:hypothetical protein